MGPPTIGPSMLAGKHANESSFHPAISVTIRGPRSLAGLIPPPLMDPKIAIMQPIAAPTIGGIAAAGTASLFLGCVTAKMMNVSTPAPKASQKNA